MTIKQKKIKQARSFKQLKIILKQFLKIANYNSETKR